MNMTKPLQELAKAQNLERAEHLVTEAAALLERAGTLFNNAGWNQKAARARLLARQGRKLAYGRVSESPALPDSGEGSAAQ